MAGGSQETKIFPNLPCARGGGVEKTPSGPGSGMEWTIIETKEDSLEEDTTDETFVLSQGGETSSDGASEGSSGDSGGYSRDLMTQDPKRRRTGGGYAVENAEYPPDVGKFATWSDIRPVVAGMELSAQSDFVSKVATRKAISAEVIYDGGNGIVWRVVCNDGVEVAVKRLDSYALRKGFGEPAVANARMEVERLWKLRGAPYVVHITEVPDGFSELACIHDSCEDLIATEWCNGGTLHEAAATATLDDTIKWWKQLCIGLSAIHKIGLVHNDLRPHNILLHDGDIRIADLGLTTPDGDEPAQLSMAPTSCFRNMIDPPLCKAEVVSIGLLVLFCITNGKAKYPRKNLDEQVLQRIYHDRLSLLRDDHLFLLASIVRHRYYDRPSLEETLERLNTLEFLEN